MQRGAAQRRRHRAGRTICHGPASSGGVLLAQQRQQRTPSAAAAEQRGAAEVWVTLQQRHAEAQHRLPHRIARRRQLAVRERRPRLLGEVKHGAAAAHQCGEQPARQHVGRREERARRGRDQAARRARCARRAFGGEVVPQRALEQHEQPRQQRVVRLGHRRHAQQPEERARRRRGARGAYPQQREQRVRCRRGTRRVQRLQQCVRSAGGLETLDARGAVVVVGARVECRQLGLHRGARLEPPRPRHLVRHWCI